MKFRPLCIDYHARAQEIIITERDYNSRRAAQSLLSHRPSELSPRHHDDDTDQSLGLNDEDGENRKPSNSLLNSSTDGTVDHRKYHPVDTSKSNERQATRREGSIANAPRSSAHGNRSITAVFGPTIPPWECALRKISPVTRGPIRGRLLPVVETITAMESIFGLHAKIGEEIFQRGIFSSLRGGCESRQQQQHSFIDDAAMFLQSGYTTIDHPMQIMDETNISDDNAAVDTIELTNAPYSPPYKLLRHEPDDLTKIQSLKSLQISNVANFASEVIKLMEPRRSSSRRKTTECGLHKVGKERPTLSAKPSLSITSCKQMAEMHNNDFAPNNNVLPLTSFYEDCHGGLDDCRSHACPILKSRKLKPYAEDHQFFMVRLDPDFDPSTCQSTSSSEKMDSAGLVSSLGEICSAAFISRELDLPRRLEHESDVQIARILHSSCSSVHKVDFVEESLNRFKESQKRDEVLLAPFVHRSDLLIGESKSFPKKIALESDLSLYDDDSIEPTTPICQSDTALTLPSFVQSLPFSCARKTTIRRSKPQKRFVDSSARVFKIDALSNICGPSKVACLYLPQIEVRDWKDRTSRNDLPSPEEQQHMALNDDLISFARECVPSSAIPASIDSLDGVDLLQGQTSSYPILSWFTCDDDIDGSELIDHVYVDQATRDLKRRSFCSNAVKVGDKERSRCVLLTGCSSRINSGRLYSYRGFLTNQIMNPRIFQRRYKSMVELNKIYQRKNISALSKGSDIAASPRQRSFYFSRMVVVDFADGFAAKMSKKKLKQKLGKSNIRGGPFVASLKTRRHGDRLPLQPIKKNRVAVMSGMQSAVAPELEYLSSSFHREKENISVNDVVGQLGRENLNVRGELLHLATKARELKEEEDAYLAELAVINRCREDTPSRASFEDEICDRVDIDVASGACGNGKREASDAIAAEEHNQEKKKKKRKKDKKKKEKKRLKKQKKSHKRKRRDDDDVEAQSDRALTEKLVGDGCDISSECEETKLQVKSVKKLRIDEAVPSTTHKPWKAVPSIALGITPIHRPTEKRAQPQPSVEMHKTPKVTDALDKNSTSHSLSSLDASSKSGKSPDSVAVANLAHDALFTKATPKNFTMMQSQALDENNYIVREHDGDSISAIDDNYRSTESFNDDISFERTSEENISTFTILTSESFLELFGESIMELASGRWFNTLTTAEKLQINSLLNCNQEPGNGLDPGIPPQAKINVSDCPLLDIAGADIELADDKALIVQRISTLTQSRKEIMKQLVNMAASGRYRSIHVILCVDTDMCPSEIVTMQNALMQQSGFPCETVTFEYTSPRTLSSSIALQFCNSSEVHKSSRISQFASDENVQERARFLICLVPTMTVHTALKCLWCADSSGRFEVEFDDDCGATAMHTLLSLARETSRELFPHKVTSVMTKACAEQLWLAVNAASSFATRQC